MPRRKAIGRSPDDGGSSRRPMMVFVHGGAFFNGDKQDDPIVKWCRHYASLGYVVVSPNYRMGFVPYREAIDKAGYRAVVYDGTACPSRRGCVFNNLVSGNLRQVCTFAFGCERHRLAVGHA